MKISDMNTGQIAIWDDKIIIRSWNPLETLKENRNAVSFFIVATKSGFGGGDYFTSDGVISSFGHQEVKLLNLRYDDGIFK